jgi:hypothetical protein
MRRTSLVLVAGLLACGAEDVGALPVEAAPPPPLTLSFEGPWYRGDVVDARMFITAPNGAVRLYASRFAAPPAACPAWLAPLCLDLRAPAVIAAVTASSSGVATATFTVPATAPEGPINLQAAAKSGGGRQKSSVQQVLIFERGGDYDGDGLRNDDELEVYLTDPTQADTDGGGLSDGEEALNGSSPRDASDDGQLGGDCVIDFAWGYASTGQGTSPTMYGAHGVSFDGFIWGMVGGGAFGDPGGWNGYGGAPNEALAGQISGSAHSLLFAEPTPSGSLRLGAVSGGDALLEVKAFMGLREVWSEAYTIGATSPSAFVDVDVPFDRIRIDKLSLGAPFYVIDDVAYQTTVPTVCSP